MKITNVELRDVEIVKKKLKLKIINVVLYRKGIRSIVSSF